MSHVVTLAVLYTCIVVLLYCTSKANQRTRSILTELTFDVMSGDLKANSPEYRERLSPLGWQVLIAWASLTLLVIATFAAGYYTALS